MKDLIERLKTVKQEFDNDDFLELSAKDLAFVATETREELDAIVEQMRVLDQEHSRQTDELRGLREEYESIQLTVKQQRRSLNIWQDEIACLGDDVAGLLTDMKDRMTEAVDDAAALRGVLEGIRDMARKAENDDSDLTEVHRAIYTRDLLGSVAHKASEGLKEHKSGAALRKDLRQLETMVETFEQGMQESGGWRYGSDRTLAERIQRLVDHYTRMAAQTVSNGQTFKDDLLSWLRGLSINAESVSWAGTHREKDARLRGLIEVIERVCRSVNEMRLEDRSNWQSDMGGWMKSDYPVREFKRRIYELEAEVKRLSGKPSDEVSHLPL